MRPFRFAFVLCAVCQLSAQSVGSVQSGPIQAGPPGAPARRLPQLSPQAEPAKPQTPASIEGQVLNASTGEPLRKANVTLMPSQPAPESGPSSTSTDANGQFSMTGVAPGTYRLMASRNGFVGSEFGSRGPMRPGTAITISPGQALKQVAVKLQPHAVIAGRIVDEDGEPLAYTQVQAMMHRYQQGKRQLMPAGNSQTNDLGEYRIFGLAPGRYYLSATHRSQAMSVAAVTRPGGANANLPDEGYAPTYYPGTNDATAAAVVHVAAGAPLSNMDIKLRRMPTIRIRGTILRASTLMSSRSMLMLLPREASSFGFGDRNMGVVQGRDGKFEMRGVTPGAYYLVAQYFDGNERFFARIPVDAGTTHIDGLEIDLKPGMEITGRVKVEGMDPPHNLAQVNIGLQPKTFTPMSGGASVRPKEDGSFVLRNVTPDEYRVSVFGGSGLYVKSVQAGQQETLNGEVNVIDGAPPVLTVVLSAAGAQLSGQVTAEKDVSAEGGMVVLVPEKRDQQQLYRMASLDQYGKFNLKSIPPGDYTLYAWDNVEPGAWQDPEFLARFENKGKKVSVKEKDNVTADLKLLKVEDAAGGG